MVHTVPRNDAHDQGHAVSFTIVDGRVRLEVIEKKTLSDLHHDPFILACAVARRVRGERKIRLRGEERRMPTPTVIMWRHLTTRRDARDQNAAQLHGFASRHQAEHDRAQMRQRVPRRVEHRDERFGIRFTMNQISRIAKPDPNVARPLERSGAAGACRVLVPQFRLTVQIKQKRQDFHAGSDLEEVPHHNPTAYQLNGMFGT